jgi:F5/8 type C domain/Protein of unknown function (DUF1349)
MAHRSSRLCLLGIFVVSLFVVMPGYAVEEVKVSNYGSGHQIWFEVEDFDERDPADDSSFALTDEAGAFGRSINSVNSSDGNGMIRYSFDISDAGGAGGTWYFWGRVINPTNNSDFMLVDGHPGDPVPFTMPVSGLVNGQRALEENVGTAPDNWAWSGDNHDEAHTKTLQDGENTMYMLSRESGARWDVFMWTDDPDYVPTDEDYINAEAPVAGAASNPSPAGGAIDVPRDVMLGWTPGESTVERDVYFGTAFSDVNEASRENPLDVLVSQGQAATSYAPAGVLAFGQTYYWRVDEVNAAPDSTIFPGGVWSFTAEPFSYPIENITVSASSTQAGSAPENTVNGSGLDADDLHGDDADTMWVTAMDAVEAGWMQFEFDAVYKLYELMVWNYNVQFEIVLGYGFKDVTIEYSENGEDWTVLADVEFAKAPSADGYASDTIVDLGGVSARYVRLTANSNWGMLTQYGLSEVRFTHIPIHAREPMPASGQQGVDVSATLNWRAGREAASHEVYLSADQAAVAEGSALVDTVTERTYNPGGLDFGQTYYWKIVEVNEAEAISAWEGDLWSFSTQEYVAVEDFESYDDADNRIFETWLDGWVNETGSTVGYFEAPFAEQTITHGGSQAMPLQYSNVDSPWYSEAERTFAASQNWAANGVDTLLLHFRGNPVAFLERADGSIVIGAAGADIWSTADEFRFVYKALTGDASIVVRVDSMVERDPWTKAGVMIRESLEAGSKFAAVYITPANGCRFHTRTASNVDATSDTSVATAEQIAITAPYWVKLERSGNEFSGFYSADGSSWTAMSWNPQTISMLGSIRIGLAVTSHSAGNPTSAEFSGMATTGNVTGAWEAATIGVAQPSNDPESVYVAVTDGAGHTAVVTHPDPEATTLAQWQEWAISLETLSAAGVNLAGVKTLSIGVGTPDNPQAGGTGTLYIDDILVGHPAAAVE